MPISRDRVLRALLTLPAILFLCAVLGSGGCIVAAVVGTVAIVAAKTAHHAETAEFERSPEQVYQAMLRAIDTYPEATLLSQDPVEYRIKAFHLKNDIEATATRIGDGKTRLTVKARAGEKDQTSEELADIVIEAIAGEVGIKYQIVSE